MSKIPILTGEIPMPDGSVIRLMLSKDEQQLALVLSSIASKDIGRDAWLAHRPNYAGVWQHVKQHSRTKAKCVICKGRVFWWENRNQLWLHCGCTQFVMPLAVPHVMDMKKISSSDWSAIVNMAVRGIEQWLATN